MLNVAALYAWKTFCKLSVCCREEVITCICTNVQMEKCCVHCLFVTEKRLHVAILQLPIMTVLCQPRWLHRHMLYPANQLWHQSNVCHCSAAPLQGSTVQPHTPVCLNSVLHTTF